MKLRKYSQTLHKSILTCEHLYASRFRNWQQFCSWTSNAQERCYTRTCACSWQDDSTDENVVVTPQWNATATLDTPVRDSDSLCVWLSLLASASFWLAAWVFSLWQFVPAKQAMGNKTSHFAENKDKGKKRLQWLKNVAFSKFQWWQAEKSAHYCDSLAGNSSGVQIKTAIKRWNSQHLWNTRVPLWSQDYRTLLLVFVRHWLQDFSQLCVGHEQVLWHGGCDTSPVLDEFRVNFIHTWTVVLQQRDDNLWQNIFQQFHISLFKKNSMLRSVSLIFLWKATPPSASAFSSCGHVNWSLHVTF